MGQFYYYPSDTGTLTTVNCGTSMQDLIVHQRVTAEDGWSRQGALYRQTQDQYWEVRLLYERWGRGNAGTSAQERALQNLVTHLQLGRPVGWSRSHSRAACWKLATAPSRGDTSLTLPSRHGFYAWNSSATVAGGDEVVVETGLAEGRSNITVVDSLSGTTLTLDEALEFTFTQDTFIRWRDFFPVLYLADPAADLVISNRRLSWTLDMTLRYSPGVLQTLFAAGNVTVLGDIKLSTSASTSLTYSLQTLLDG